MVTKRSRLKKPGGWWMPFWGSFFEGEWWGGGESGRRVCEGVREWESGRVSEWESGRVSEWESGRVSE